MASTRITTQKRRTAQTAAPQAPKQALGALARYAAHLRELSALPRAAANQFDTRLARVSIDHKEVR
jgi:hypothetical protein